MKKLLPILVLILIGCSEPEPINIKLLRNIDGVYYDSNNKPYSGEVFRTFSDNSGDIWFSGRLEKGSPINFIEPINFDKVIVYRNNKPYLINTDVPFSGPFYIEIDGDVIEEGTYLGGNIDNILIGYFNNGQVEYKSYFEDGEEINNIFYYRNGKIKSRNTFKKKETIINNLDDLSNKKDPLKEKTEMIKKNLEKNSSEN